MPLLPALLSRRDPRAQPGAYLTSVGRLFYVLAINDDGGVWLENCATEHRHTLPLSSLASYRLVKAAPQLALPDFPPDPSAAPAGCDPPDPSLYAD
jgi:hypothetical protein